MLNVTCVCVRDGEGDEADQSPMWTFPPTLRPVPINKHQRGNNHAESKVGVCTLTSLIFAVSQDW